MRIAISPDENPGDPGSASADGISERSVNLGVAAALRDALARCGQDVWFDPDLTFEERVARANGDGTALLVACAHNSSTPGASGTQFVFCPGGQEFGRQAAAAAAVYAQLAQLPGWPARRGDAVEEVYEACAFAGDTVYIEYLFMSPDDRVLWGQPGYAVRVAEATARGLAATYGFTYVSEEVDMFGPDQEKQLGEVWMALQSTEGPPDEAGRPQNVKWQVADLLGVVRQLQHDVALIKAKLGA